MKSIKEKDQTNLNVIAHTATVFLPFSHVSTANNNATVIKNSMGTIGSITAINITATIHYLKFYNKDTTPSPASDTPVAVYPIPASTDGAGLTINIPSGLRFSKGISFAIVKGIASNNNTSADANAVVVTIAYK